MKKYIAILGLVIVSCLTLSAQIKIHSHNDYTHSKPFYGATQNKAYSIEADIFLVGDSLFVAHSKKEIKAGNTLENLYLNPIKLFSKTKNFYSFQLMIDIKDDWNVTYPVLLKYLNKYKKAFSKKGKTVSIAISGNRPPDSTFHLYPQVIMFDGLPNRVYKEQDLNKIAMISDNFRTYSKWNGTGEIPESDKVRLLKVIKEAHQNGKICRFWNAPDNENSWQVLQNLGADIINTDKVKESTKYFEQKVK